MCRKVSCQACSERSSDGSSTDGHENPSPATEKYTWWGCGQHVPQVMDSIPEKERCTCEPQVEKDGKLYPPKGQDNISVSAAS